VVAAHVLNLLQLYADTTSQKMGVACWCESTARPAGSMNPCKIVYKKYYYDQQHTSCGPTQRQLSGRTSPLSGADSPGRHRVSSVDLGAAAARARTGRMPLAASPAAAATLVVRGLALSLHLELGLNELQGHLLGGMKYRRVP
jgi:hypothetical protein